MRAFRGPSIFLLVLLQLWPSLAIGQGSKAGVVSTLQGTATATRATSQQPVSLKFKDEVFLQDRISTGDQSIARILLGGKALVTVRERSVLTITEVPGRSTVGLESGKIGLAVARERMAPGESVDIRTSNAIAAVRGTVVIAEVSRTTAQVSPGAPQIVTNFYVLRDATNRGVVVTQLVSGSSTTVLPGQGFSVLGAAAGRSVPIPPNVVADLQTRPGEQHSAASPQVTSNVASIQTQQAVALTEAVLGAPSQLAAETQVVTPQGLSAPAEQTEPSFENTAQAGSEQTDVPGGTSISGAAALIPPPPVTGFLPDITGTFTGTHVFSVAGGESQTLTQPLVIVRDGDINLTGEFLEVAGDLTGLDGQALILIDPSRIVAPGLLRVTSPGSVTLSGPLLDARGTAASGASPQVPTQFFIQGDVIRITATTSDARVASTSPLPFVTLIDSSIGPPAAAVNGHFVLLDGGAPTPNAVARLVLAGPLLTATDSAIALTSPTNEFLRLQEGAVVQGTGTGVFVQLVRSAVAVGDPLATGNSEFVELGPGDSMSLAGGMLSAGQSTVTVHNSPVVRQTGGTFTSSGNVVALTDSTLNAAAVLDVSGGSATVTGAVVSADTSAIHLPGGAVIAISGGTTTVGRGVALVNSNLDVAGGTVVTVNGGTLNATAAAALIGADPSSVSAQTLLSIGLLGGSVTLAGPVLDATDTTFTITGDVLSIANGTLTSTTTSPAVTLLRSNLSMPGRFLDVSGGAAVTLGGPLLRVTDADLAVSGVQPFLHVRNSASVTGNSTEAFVQSARTVAGTNSVSFTAGLLLQESGVVILQGGLLSAGGTAITGAGTALLTQDGGTFTSAGAELVQLSTGASLTVSNELLALNGGTFGSSGVLLSLDNATATVAGDAGVVISSGGTLNTAGAYRVGNSGALTLTAPGSAAVLVFGGTLNTTSATTPLVSVTNGALSSNGSVLGVSDAGTATLAAQALSATSSTLSFSGTSLGVVFVDSAGTLTATGSVPLVEVTAGTLSLGGNPVLRVLDGTATLAGPAFADDGTGLSGSAPLVSVPGGFLVANGTSVVRLNGIIAAGLPPALSVIDNGVVHSAGPVLSVAASSLGFASDVVSLDTGGFLRASGLLSQTGSAISVTGNLLRFLTGSNVEITGGQSAISVTGTSLTVTGALVQGGDSAPNGSNFLLLSGPLLTATDATISVGAVAVLGPTDGINPIGTAPVLELTDSNLTVAAGPVLALDFGGPCCVTFNGQVAVIDVGSVTVADTFLTLGNVNSTSVDPLIRAVDATITQTNTAKPLVSLKDGTVLAGPLLELIDSQVLDFSRVLQTAGTVTSNGTGSLVTADPSLIRTAGNVFSIGGTFGVHGPLLTSTSSTITSGADVLRIVDAATLVDQSATTSPTALLTFSGGSVSTTGLPGNLVNLDVDGNPSGVATLALKRPLVSASSTSMSLVNGLLRIGPGGTVSSIDVNPFVQIFGGSYTGGTGTDGAILRMALDGCECLAPLLTLAGAFLNVGGGATVTTQQGSLVELAEGAQVTIGAGSPFMLLSGAGTVVTSAVDGVALRSGSTLTADHVLDLSGGASLTVPGNVLSLDASALTTGVALDLTGSSILNVGGSAVRVVNDSTLDVGGTVISVDNATVTGTSAAALIEATSSAVGAFKLVTIGAGGSIALAGPVLNATDVGFTVTGNLLEITGGTLTSTTLLPAVALLRSDLLGLQEFFRINAGSTLFLHGGLLSADSTNLSSVGSFILQTGGAITSLGAELVKLSAGSSLVMSDAFLTQTGGSLTSSGVLLGIDGSGGPTSAQFNAAVGVLVSSGATLTTGGGYRVDGPGASVTFTTPFASAFTVDNATLNTTSASSALLDVANGGTATISGAVLTVRNNGTATLAGRILNAGESTASFTGPGGGVIVVDTNATLQATGTDPLIAVPSGTLSFGSETVMVVTGGATATIAAPLLSASSAVLTSSATMVVIINGTLTANLPSGTALLNLNSISNTDPGLPEAIEVLPGGTLTSTGPLVALNCCNDITFNVPMIVVSGGTLTSGSLLSQHFGTTTEPVALVDLSAGASATIVPGDSAFTIFGGTLSVGSLVTVANSTLTVSAGNLLCAGCLCPGCGSPSTVIVNGSMLRLNGGATVTTNGGALISAADASLVLVTGAAVEFSGSGNTVTITNGVAPTATIAGIPVSATNGGFVSVGPGALLGAGAFNVTGSALVAVDPGTLISIDPFLLPAGPLFSVTNVDTGASPLAIFQAGVASGVLAGPPVVVTAEFGRGIAQLQGPVIHLNSDGTVSTNVDLITIDGVSLVIAGSLLEGTSTTVIAGSGAQKLLNVASGALLRTFSSVGGSAPPLVHLDGDTVSAGLATVNGIVALAGPLLQAGATAFTTSGEFLSISGGTLRSSEAGAVIAISLGTVNVSGRFVDVDGVDAAVILNGGLLGMDGADLAIGQELLRVRNLAFVTGARTGHPFIELLNGSLSVVHVANIDGQANVTIEDTLFVANGTTLTVSGPLVLVSDAALFVSGDLLSLSNINAPPTLPQLLAVGSAGNVHLAGSVLASTNSTLGVAADAIVVSGGNLFTSGLLSQTGGSLTISGSLLTLSALAVAEINSNLSAVTVKDGTVTLSGSLVTADNTGSALSLSGPLLSAINSAIDVSGAILASGATDEVFAGGRTPLLQLTDSTLTVGAMVTGGDLFLNGPLLRSINSTITSNAPGPVASFTASTVITPRTFVNVSAGAVTFHGSLISATDSLFNIQAGGFGATRRAGGLEPAFGSNLFLSDDQTTTSVLPFSFPFQGQNFNSVGISSNGFVSFGGDFGADCCDGTRARLLAAGRRAAAAWFDLNPSSGGQVRFNTFADRAVVTFDMVPECCLSGTNTFQIQIFSDGRVRFVYGAVAAGGHQALIGVSPGGGAADPGPINFFTSLPFNSGVVGTVYQEFPAGTLDAGDASLTFTPNGLGGWIVTGDSLRAFIRVAGGASFTQQGAGAIVDLLRTGLTIAGQFMVVDGSGASGTAVHVVEQLLTAVDSPLTITGALVESTSGTLATTGGGGSPFVSITRDTHAIATDTNTAMFDLLGFSTAVQTLEGNDLSLGTEAVLQPGDRVLLQTDAATVTTNGLAVLDTVLLNATKPILNMLNNSNVTSAGPLVNLANRANLTASLVPSDALVKLDASRLTINNGSMFNVAGGSALLVTGHLLGLNNSSVADILLGSLVTVSGGSVFRLTTGSLTTFGAGTNALNIANNTALCGGCSVVTNVPNLAGVPVLLRNGATAGNLSVAPGFVPFAGVGGSNSVNVTGASGAVLTVDGATSRVRLAP